MRFAARTVNAEGYESQHRQIRLMYVCERGHRPAEHGVLMFDPGSERWLQRHRDRRLQRMAECFLQSYLQNRKGQGIEPAAT